MGVFFVAIAVALLGILALVTWLAGLAVMVSMSFALVAWSVGATVYAELAGSVFLVSLGVWFVGFILLMFLSFLSDF